jgi:hypothetical protein
MAGSQRIPTLKGLNRPRFRANDATLSGLGVLDGVSTQGGAALALGYNI